MKRAGDDGDERLSRLLRASQAEADPVLWTRARARIEAADRPTPLAWLVRPRALAASLALFAVAVVTAVALMHAMPWQQPYEAVTLTDQLITEQPAAGAVTPAPARPGPGSRPDSGSAS